ncbi:MAG: PEP/pyruvate-binding domain-containing protein [bacterium]
MSNLILLPQKIRRVNPDILGGKGANLVRLFQHGFKVPPFFVISTKAYEQFLSDSGGVETIQEMKKVWEQKGVSADLEAPRRLLKIFETYPVSKELARKIEQELQKYFKDVKQNAPLAVRSSATVEDAPEYSFAGVFETSFGDCRTLLERIKSCWASLWREAALFYFARIGVKPWEVSMAVIVQQTIPAEAAGILFTTTQHPELGEVLRIEANWGLGTTLVSAKSSPDIYLLSKKNSHVLQKVLGRKEILAMFRDGNKLVETATAESQRSQFVFEERQANTLGELGRQIEQCFGQPQDVEWAFWQRQFYLLQSRPISRASLHTLPKVRKIWTPFFFLERFPQPVSLLGWSLLEEPVINRAFREPLSLLGRRRFAKQRLTHLFYGRLYSDIDVFRLLYGFIPPAFLAQDKQSLISVSGEKLPSWFERLYLYLPFLVRTVSYDSNWFFIFHLRNWRNFTHWYWAQIRKFKQMELSNFSKEQLLVKLLAAQNLTDQFLKLHRWSITYADVFFQLLNSLCRRWLKENRDIHAVSLLSGLEGNLTVEMNLALWELSRVCTKNAALKEYLFTVKPVSLEQIKKISGSEDFISTYKSFLRKYGHRSNSLDILYPTWSEDATYVLDVVRKFFEVSEEDSPARSEALRKEHQKAMTRQALDKLSKGLFQRIMPIKRMIFLLIVHFAKAFVLLRENQRFYWQMSIAQMRRIALELGKHLVSENKIEAPDEVFFLHLNELRAFICKGKEIKWKEVVTERKTELQRNQKETPAILVKELEDGSFDFEFGGEDVEILYGMPISPGKARGRAKVISDLRQFVHLRKGDILITPSLDPGWTPIFGLISGLAMEVGGMLSHGSILAREFGIPAVSNVRGLTHKINDGDEIVVDGNLGQVIK